MLRGYFVSIEEGSAGKRVLVGFGSGTAEMRAAVEGYQMTAQGLRLLGSGEVRSGGGAMPGVAVPLAVLAATANPIGLVVGGGAKLYGRRREATGSDTIEGSRGADGRRNRGAAANGIRGAGLDLVEQGRMVLIGCTR